MKIIHYYIIPKEYKKNILDNIKTCFDDIYKEVTLTKKGLKIKQNNLEKKSSRLLDLVCNDTISEDKYKEENNQIVIDQEKIKEELLGIHDFDLVIINEAKELVELLTKLDIKWKNADNKQKLNIIKMIVVEFFVDNKKQLYVQKTELFELLKVLYGCSWQGLMANRGTVMINFLRFIAKKKEYNEIIKKIKKVYKSVK